VLASRHRFACVVVARADIPELLDAHPSTKPVDLNVPSPPAPVEGLRVMTRLIWPLVQRERAWTVGPICVEVAVQQVPGPAPSGAGPGKWWSHGRSRGTCITKVCHPLARVPQWSPLLTGGTYGKRDNVLPMIAVYPKRSVIHLTRVSGCHNLKRMPGTGSRSSRRSPGGQRGSGVLPRTLCELIGWVCVSWDRWRRFVLLLVVGSLMAVIMSAMIGREGGAAVEKLLTRLF